MTENDYDTHEKQYLIRIRKDLSTNLPNNITFNLLWIILNGKMEINLGDIIEWSLPENKIINQ